MVREQLKTCSLEQLIMLAPRSQQQVKTLKPHKPLVKKNKAINGQKLKSGMMGGELFGDRGRETVYLLI